VKEMNNINSLNNSYGEQKVIDACSIFGMMDTSGNRFSGCDITKAIANMHDRGNGLGGGFGVYGLYPEYADNYAFHIMYLDPSSQSDVERFLKETFKVHRGEEIPVKPIRSIKNPPSVWRYFLDTIPSSLSAVGEEDFIVEQVMKINTQFSNAFVFSSGKNMAVFKGVGFPEDISEYFMLENYEAYLWTAHGRFPTNTVGWWGGAHPFNILDWTVVHNGEISSYGINRRYLEQFDYKCTMHTDTEVVAYAIDLLIRKHGLSVEVVADILAPPMWSDIERRPESEQTLLSTLRQIYGSLLMNGPFTVVIAHSGEMIGLTDRIRLRPLTVGEKGSILYLSSEESAIRLICPDLDKAWIPTGGEPVIGRLGEPLSTSREEVLEMWK
jgi:glutamate synthase domain-containing protein 1